MAIDLIEARKDLREIRARSVFYTKQDGSSKTLKELNKVAFPLDQEKVHSFDDIMEALGQG